MFKKHKKLVKAVDSLGERVDGLFTLLVHAGLIAKNEGFTIYSPRGGYGYHVNHYVNCLRSELDALVEGLGYEIAMEPERAIEPKIVLRKISKEKS